MSLSVSDVWEAGVWDETVWASGVWAESAAATTGAPGHSLDKKWKRKWTYRPDLAEEEEEKVERKRKILKIIKPDSSESFDDEAISESEIKEIPDKDVQKLMRYLEKEQLVITKKKRIMENDIAYIVSKILGM